MVRPISQDDKNRVINLWFQSHTYREIEVATGVSVGAISAIIREVESHTPDIHSLRKLKQELDKSRANLPQALRGAMFLAKLNEMNIPPDTMYRAINFIGRSGWGERTNQMATYGLKLLDLETQTGKEYTQVVEDFQRKTATVTQLRTTQQSLEKDEEILRDSIRNLKTLKTIQDNLGSLGLAPDKLNAFIKDLIELEKLGFNLEKARILAKEMAERSFDPQKTAQSIVDILHSYTTLEKAIEEKRKESTHWQGKTQDLITEYGEWNREVTALQVKWDNLETDINKLLKHYKEEEEKSGTELQRLTVERNRLETEVKQLSAALSNAADAEERLEKIKLDIAPLGPLAILFNLMKKPKSITDSPKDVLGVFLPLLEGLEKYRAANWAKLKNNLRLGESLGHLIGELSEEIGDATIRT